MGLRSASGVMENTPERHSRPVKAMAYNCKFVHSIKIMLKVIIIIYMLISKIN